MSGAREEIAAKQSKYNLARPSLRTQQHDRTSIFDLTAHDLSLSASLLSSHPLSRRLWALDMQITLNHFLRNYRMPMKLAFISGQCQRGREG